MMPFDLPLLSLLIWVPILGGVWVLLAAGDNNAPTAKAIALIVSLITLVLSIPLYTSFDFSTAQMQFAEKHEWISAFNIYYSLGVDGFSMPLIILNTFITVVVIISAWEVIKYKTAQYMAAFLIMDGLMNGVFAATDAMMFYVFWEAILIPMFLIIGIWGGPNRVYATIKFFLYTFLGSVFMLVALLYLYSQTGSFAIADMQNAPLAMMPQILIFLAFLVAFAVKVPMFPVHTWLPDAHVEAPTGGSVLLAALMLKMGGYGFIRFSLPITPDASRELDWLIIGLSLIAIAYIGFVAIVQKDMKKLIAYSSISHMGFVTLGFFIGFSILENPVNSSGAVMGIEGAMMQMISHGFISAALFLCVGVLYDRMHSRNIADYGGVVNTMPVFAAFMMLFVMANSGLPGTSGFVGEFMVILSSMKASFWIAFVAATILLLGAGYNLWMYKRVIYGKIGNDRVAALTDVTGREVLILASLAIPTLLFGIWPDPIIEIMHPTVENLIAHIVQSKL